MQAEQDDGPYVLYKGDMVFAKYIMNDQGLKLVKADSVELKGKESLSIMVATDEPGKIFPVRLKKKLEVEKSECKKCH